MSLLFCFLTGNWINPNVVTIKMHRVYCDRISSMLDEEACSVSNLLFIDSVFAIYLIISYFPFIPPPYREITEITHLSKGLSCVEDIISNLDLKMPFDRNTWILNLRIQGCISCLVYYVAIGCIWAPDCVQIHSVDIPISHILLPIFLFSIITYAEKSWFAWRIFISADGLLSWILRNENIWVDLG